MSLDLAFRQEIKVPPRIVPLSDNFRFAVKVLLLIKSKLKILNDL